MRTRVSSRRPWRISSWPAACGMRWVKPSSATTSPSWTRPAMAWRRDWISATGASEGERPGAALHADPAQLGELVDRGAAAETSPARVLDAAERHLRLVVHRLVVDVDDARVERFGQRHPVLRVG